jgi:copper(I)-binding protein
MKKTFLTLGIILLAATAQAEVQVNNAWARTTPPSVHNGAIYFELKNIGAVEDILLSAHSPASKLTEIHNTVADPTSGVMRMQKVERLPISPNGGINFAPGGYHVMLIGLTEPLKEELEIPLTLTFEKQGEKTLRVKINSLRARNFENEK